MQVWLDYNPKQFSYIDCNNPTNNIKGAALYARCQAVCEREERD